MAAMLMARQLDPVIHERMRYDDFVQQRTGHEDFIILDKDHCVYLTYADIGTFEDKGWPRKYDKEDHKFLVLVGLIVNHRRPDGETCGGYVGLAKPKKPSIAEAQKPLWSLTQLSPLTLHPSIQCHCGRMHGFIRGGKWVGA